MARNAGGFHGDQKLNTLAVVGSIAPPVTLTPKNALPGDPPLTKRSVYLFDRSMADADQRVSTVALTLWGDMCKIADRWVPERTVLLIEQHGASEFRGEPQIKVLRSSALVVNPAFQEAAALFAWASHRPKGAVRTPPTASSGPTEHVSVEDVSA